MNKETLIWEGKEVKISMCTRVDCPECAEKTLQEGDMKGKRWTKTKILMHLRAITDLLDDLEDKEKTSEESKEDLKSTT